MESNPTETTVSLINVNVFFKEFSFSKNDFIDVETNQMQEFADNVVWLDDIFFIYQIKDRKPSDSDDIKWFENKVLKIGVRQIKKTLQYLNTCTQVTITNAKGHKVNISEAKKNSPRKIIVYTPGNLFPEHKRFIKFYESGEVGLIHLFHSEDYYWICKYLLTPAEVDEYLYFREAFYNQQKLILNKFPEQYILAHFLETLETDHIDSKYIDNLKIIDNETIDFDISFLIDNFTSNIRTIKHETEYYPIIREIAKLNRSEMAEFKKRFVRCLEVCKKNKSDLPYRVYFPRTDCGFVFIPLTIQESSVWKRALNNFTIGHKYDRKAGKCVGVATSYITTSGGNNFDINWVYMEFPWKFDLKIDSLLRENFPFREVKHKQIYNRYKKQS
ncbi:MAG: hypothetical protein F9K32_18530 [Desulfobulbaceae bacterium]|nr:MAG: hypothetical protein F9K32_18530 [Desulfobulbaceae bacterium]